MSNTGAENNTSLNGLSYAENKLVTDAEAWLENNNPKECFLVKERFSHLRVLGNAVFSYPSIRHTHFLNGVVRGEGQLAKALLAFSKSSHLLHIPTKVVTMRGFLVAKYHAFSLLFYLLNEKPDWQAEVRNIAFSVISTLMAEAVYFSCLEDAGFSQKTK
ncbi:MAG: hypothetical protein FWH41_05065, partial [Treponema sp.]|nr:hypothetical protein [Treponema sp.]